MAKQRKIYGIAGDFIRDNIPGAIVGGGIGALFSFFQPLFVITMIAFSYFTPVGLDFNGVWFKVVLTLGGALIGMLINSIFHRR
jgi:hypothetical protein